MKVSIVSVTVGFSQVLKNGHWVNTTDNPQRFETEILAFGQCFSSESECEKFIATKAFKSVLASIQKNWE
jgi:hypothetical protein